MLITGNVSFNRSAEQAKMAFYKPFIIDALLRQGYFRIMNGVVGETEIGYIGDMENVLQPDNGCDDKVKGNIPLSSRRVKTDAMKVVVSVCAKDIMQTFWRNTLNLQNKDNKLMNSLYLAIVLRKVGEAIRKDLNKLAIFGKKTSTDENLSLTDGVLHQMAEGISSGAIAYTDMESGNAFAPGEAVRKLQEVIDNAPEELEALDPDQKVMLIPNHIYRAVRRDIQDGLYNSNAFGETIINGVKFDTFDGIPIARMHNWKRYAKLAGYGDFFNLVIYQAMENMVFATADFSQLYSLEVWYERKDNRYYCRARLNAGFNYTHNKLLSVGY